MNEEKSNLKKNNINNKKFSKKGKIKIKKIHIVIIKSISFILLFICLILAQKIKRKIVFSKASKPKIIAITFGNVFFQRQLDLNKKSALEAGIVDEHIIYGPDDMYPEFKEKNKNILSRFRGNGFWLWKPYFIYKTFKEKLKEVDYLIYTEAGILYMNSTY